MKVKILILLFILLILWACKSPHAPEPEMMIHIEGIVTNATNNKPIGGVVITVYRVNWIGGPDEVFWRVGTNRKGRYSIDAPFAYSRCVAGNVGSIKAEKDGYDTVVYLTINPDAQHVLCTEELQKIDFQLYRY